MRPTTTNEYRVSALSVLPTPGRTFEGLSVLSLFTVPADAMKGGPRIEKYANKQQYRPPPGAPNLKDEAQRGDPESER